MKHTILFMLTVMASLAILPSCSDNLDEPKTNLHCVLPDYFDNDHIFTGNVVYDSTYKHIAVILDTTSLSPSFRRLIPKYAAYTLHPEREKSFNLEVGDAISFHITKLEYINFGDSIYLMGAINDITTSNLIKSCTVFDGKLKSRSSFDTNFHNEIVTSKIVKVYLHIIRDINGIGNTTPTQVMSKIRQGLNTSFHDAQIAFDVVSYEFHDYTTPQMSCYLHDEEFVYNLLSTLKKYEDGINIYYMSISKTGSSGAHHREFPNCFITNTPISSNWAHEMGHCFGLEETHFGTAFYHGRGKNDGGKPEYADGSNGDTAGDYMRDTPADPNCWSDDGKTYIGTFKDAKGSYYTPDPHNFMSYSYVGTTFSPLQIKKMHKTLRVELPYVLIHAQITGPKHFTGSATYTHTSLDNVYLRWNVVRHITSNTTDIPETVITEQYPDGTLSLSSSKSEFLEIRVVDGSSNAIYESYTATTGAPTPVTGTLFWRTQQSGTWEGATTNMDWGNTLYVSGNTTLYLGYEDRAMATLSNLGYRTVTAANRTLTGSTMNITKGDCSAGYLKFRLSDSCGQGDDYFTIPVSVIGGYYAVNVDSDNGITFTGISGAAPSGRPGAKPKAPIINTIKIYASDGALVAQRVNENVAEMTFNTSAWMSGEYRAVLSDGADYTQEIPFAI